MQIKKLAGVAVLALVGGLTGQSAAVARDHPHSASSSGVIKLTVKPLPGYGLPKDVKNSILCPYEFDNEYGKAIGSCARLKHSKVTLKGVQPGKVTVAPQKMKDRATCDPKAIHVEAGKTTKATWTIGVPCTVIGGT